MFRLKPTIRMITLRVQVRLERVMPQVSLA
jgi:hypothetical protein